jgi:DNA-binding response OmpR family regulator
MLSLIICQLDTKNIFLKQRKKMGTGERKILVVDDNLEFAEMVTRILEEEGLQVFIAPNGNKAIEKVLSESPELVLLDLKLPDIDGMEVFKKIKAINENTAIIIITGYGGEQVAVDFMKAGAMDFLSKPVEKGALSRAVWNALKMRNAQIQDEQFGKQSGLDKFFPFLAHEIRNPLHAIGGAIAIIQRRSNLKDELLHQSIKIVQEEVQHLNDFVQECLDFVRPPRRGRFIDVEINDVISVVINMMSHMFDRSDPLQIRSRSWAYRNRLHRSWVGNQKRELAISFLPLLYNENQGYGFGIGHLPKNHHGTA